MQINLWFCRPIINKHLPFGHNCYSINFDDGPRQDNPYVGIAAPFITLESEEQRNNTTFAKSSGDSHLLKSAFGIALLFD
jgi:hypothetical protein